MQQIHLFVLKLNSGFFAGVKLEELCLWGELDSPETQVISKGLGGNEVQLLVIQSCAIFFNFQTRISESIYDFTRLQINISVQIFLNDIIIALIVIINTVIIWNNFS